MASSNLPRSTAEKDLALQPSVRAAWWCAIEKAHTEARLQPRDKFHETAEGDKPRSSAAAAKLPRSNYSG